MRARLRFPRLGGSRLPALALLGATAVVALGQYVAAGGTDLGTAEPPFVMGRLPRLDPLAAVTLVLAALAAWVVPRMPERLRRDWAFGLGLFAVALVLGLAMNVMRTGLPGIWEVHELGPGGSFTAKNEYLPGLAALQWGLLPFLDRFAEIGPATTVNVIGHPPGFMVLLHVLGIQTAPQVGLLVAVLGSTCAPLAWMLGRELLADEAAARRAGVLTALSPGLLLIGVSAVDYVFAALGVLAAWLLLTRPRVLGGLAFAVAAFSQWALLAIGAWVVFVTWQRRGFWPGVRLGALCAAWVLGTQLVIHLLTGYDPISTLLTTEQVYRESLAQIRPYWFWVMGSPTAWAVLAGLPLIAWWLVALGRREPAAVALFGIAAIAAGLGFSKAETERIWLFMIPLAAVAAASALPARRLPLVGSLLILQGLLVQWWFNVVW